MTYATEIKEIEVKPFAEIYEITSGSRVFRYTSYGKDVIFGGNTYTAATIKSNIPTEDDNFKANRIKVTMPVVSPIGEYIANSPIEPTEIKVTRYFIHDPTASKFLFLGRVLGITFVDNGDVGVALADVESNSLYFRNKIPRKTFKAFCNNTLYFPSVADDPDCNLNKLDFEVSAVITISGSELNSASFGAFADGYFIGGHVESAYGDFRYISDHISNDITINVPFDARLVDGATVKAYPGCDKSPATCISKFSNFDQFIGFPFVPSNNPTIWGADK